MKLGQKYKNIVKNIITEEKNIIESVNTQYLYHGMWKDQYEFCKKQNKLFGHSDIETFFKYNKKGERIGRILYGISTSRDAKVSMNFMEKIIKEYKNEWKSNPYAVFSKKYGEKEKYITKDDDLSYVVLVLDYNKIKQNNKIIPFSFLAGSQKNYYGDEQEEFIIGDLKNLNNYVVNVIEFNDNLNKNTINSKNINETVQNNEYIAYHGSPNKFKKFNNNFLGTSTSKYETDDIQSAKLGHFFTTDKEYSNLYGKYRYKCKITLNNPLIYDMSEYIATDEKIVKIINQAKENGNDGVILKNIREYGRQPSTEYIVFNSNQIETINSKNINESFVKNPITHNVECYYSKSDDEVKQIVKNLFKDIPVRILYDFKNEVYIFGNANDKIHIQLLEIMNSYGKFRYPSSEEKMYEYMDKYCAMFKIINTNDYKSYSRSDGYKMGIIGKLDTDMYVILRDNTLAIERSSITGKFVPDELSKCKKVPMLSNVKFVNYDIRGTALKSKEQLPQNLVNESFEPKLNDNFWKWFGNSKVVDSQGNPLVVYHGSSKLFNTFKQMKSKSGQLGADLGFWFTDNENIAKRFSNNSFILDTDKKTYNEYIKSNEYSDKIKELKKKNKITLEYRINLYKDIVDKDEITNDELEYLKNIPLLKLEDIKEKKYRAVYEIYKIALEYYKDDLKALNNEIKRYFSNNKDKPTVYSCYLSIQNPLVVKGEDIGVSWQRYSVISSAIDEGYDGVIIIDGDTGAGLSNEYVVFNPNQIKSVNNNGNWSTTSNYINESKEVKLNDNFKKWFRNSKIIDENGNPLVCYHGSPNTFEIFDEKYFGLNNIKGFWFSNDKKVGEHYKQKNGKLYSCYIRLENPYILKTPDMSDEERFKRTHIFRSDKNPRAKLACEDLKKEGYDGILSKDDDGYIEVIAFYPNQIKSVNNNGNWSTTSNNINESVRPQYLYHSTWKRNYENILNQNKIIGQPITLSNNKNIKGVSVSRNKNVCKNLMNYRINNNYSDFEDNEDMLFYDGNGNEYYDSKDNLTYYILIFDYDKLKQDKKIIPHSYHQGGRNGEYGDEQEEIIVGDLNNVKKYLIDVEEVKYNKTLNESASYGGANWQNNMDALGNVPATIGHNLFMTMFPYHFLSLCPKYSYGDDKFFDDYIESKKPIGIPFLIVDFNFDTKTIEVQDHEGRHRVAAISRRKNGNIVDIPVALLYSKNRYPQIPSIEELRKNWTIISQKGDREYNVGQFSVYNSFPKSISDKWFNLYESIQLNEGIEEVKKYFPKIQDSDFTKLIALDPTYRGGNELGKYGKWILALYNTFLKDKESYAKWEEQKKLGQNYPQPIRKSQEQIEDFDKIPAILKDFDVMNTKLRVNINNIKSIADLYKIVNDAKNQGVSTNSQVNKGIGLIKKSVEKGGKVVFKDSNWIVLVPETLESSVVFGNDTNWCTTSPNGEMYYGYKNKFGGQYFINLNLQTGELYQFHFESKQFMDKNDNSIEIVPLLNNNISLFNFYKKHFGNSLIGKTTCGIMFVDNPTEEMQMKIIRQDGSAIQYINNPAEKVQLAVVKKNGFTIQYINNPSEKVQLAAVKQDGKLIRWINNPSAKVQLIAVKQDGKLIGDIENPTEKVQLEAIKQRWYTIDYIENPTEKVKAVYKKLYGKIYESKQLNEHGINDIKIEIDEILSSNYHQIYFDTYNHIVKIVCNNNKEATYSFDFSKDIDKFNKLCRSLLARFEKNFDFRLTIEQVYNKIEEYNGDSISKNAVHTILKGYYKDFIKSII